MGGVVSSFVLGAFAMKMNAFCLRWRLAHCLPWASDFWRNRFGANFDKLPGKLSLVCVYTELPWTRLPRIEVSTWRHLLSPDVSQHIPKPTARRRQMECYVFEWFWLQPFLLTVLPKCHSSNKWNSDAFLVKQRQSGMFLVGPCHSPTQ